MTSTNPFMDDVEDVDDFVFLAHPPHGRSGYILGKDSPPDVPYLSNPEASQRMILDERRRIEERTLQSTHASLGLIHESEQMGIGTAEELVHQREQLQNTEKNLDSINSTMRISQKHINSIKSMFGGIKTFFGKGNADSAKQIPVVSPTASQSTGLQNTIGNLRSTQREFVEPVHPALRTRGIAYEDDDDEMDFGKPSPAARSDILGTSVDFEDKFDRNLVDISSGIGRLKNLAIGLNEEIVEQNEMLERINMKTDHADETLEYQNRQIKRILKK